MVMHYCFKAHIFRQGLLHDLSKYNPIEFFNSAKYYTDNKHSPTEDARKEVGYSGAWLHHKGRNRHHSEYWTDYDYKTGLYVPVRMPRKYIIENVCDRIAASRNYMGKKYEPHMALDYFNKQRNTLVMHEETKREVERLLTMYSEIGEKEFFKYLSKVYRKMK